MARDPALDEELSRLGEDERAWVERQLAMRLHAEELASRLALDADDVFHIRGAEPSSLAGDQGNDRSCSCDTRASAS